MLGPVSVNRRPEIEAFQASSGINLTVSVVDADHSTMAAGRNILEQSDLIIAVNDPLVLTRENAKWLLYVAYQQHKPVIGFSKAYVTAGAAAAVYSEPEQIARHTALQISAWHASEDRCLPRPEFSRYFRVAINHAVSDSLGGARAEEDEIARRILEIESP